MGATAAVIRDSVISVIKGRRLADVTEMTM
jgi:hypothetical protein